MVRYLVAFGNEGLECVLNLDKMIEEDTLEKLSADDPSKVKSKLAQTLNMLHLRFRVNMHRHIKSYILEYDGQERDIWDNAKFIIKKLKKEGKKIDI